MATERFGVSATGTPLNWNYFLPNPALFPPPWHVACCWHGGGWANGSRFEINGIASDFAAAGIVGLACDYEKTITMLPGQSGPVIWPNQQPDCVLAILAARNPGGSSVLFGKVTGKVGAVGGSAGATLATDCGLMGVAGVDKADVVCALSANFDFADQDSLDQYEGQGEWLNEIYLYTDVPDRTHLVELAAKSVLPLVPLATSIAPIYMVQANRDAIGPPTSQMPQMVAALQAVNFNNYVATLVGGSGHAKDNWPLINPATGHVVRDDVIAFFKTAFNATPPPITKSHPIGLYNLLGGNVINVEDKPFLTNPAMDGCRARIGWTDIQPDDGATYDWTGLDTALATCALNSKYMGLSISAGTATPLWVYSSPTITQFSCEGRDGSPVIQPLPWQAGYKAKLDTFINALAARYDENVFFSYMVMTGFMQFTPLEFLFTDADVLACDIIAQTDGYADTEEAYVTASKAIIDSWMTAFPKTALILTLEDPFPGERGPRVRNQINNYGRQTYGNRYGTLNNGLHASLPPHPPPTQVFTYPYISQMYHQSSYAPGIYQGDVQPDPYPPPPQPLEDCLLNGWTQGRNVIEVYESDVNNQSPASQAVLQEVHDLLHGSDIPPPPVLTKGFRLTLTGGPYTLPGAVNPAGEYPPETLSAVITDLTPSTLYHASLLAFNEFGDGKPATYDFTSPVGEQKTGTCGIYQLLQSSGGDWWSSLAGQPSLDFDYIKGYRGRSIITNVQPSSPVGYDWSDFTDAIDTYITPNNKKLGLSVAIGISTPAWWYDTGGATEVAKIAIDLADITPQAYQPVFWDPDHLLKMATWVTAMGGQWDGHSEIAYILITGFMQSVDAAVSKTAVDDAKWLTAATDFGYSTKQEAYMDAATQIIQMYITAFPNTPLLFTTTKPWKGSEGGPTQAAIESYVINNTGGKVGLTSNVKVAAEQPWAPPVQGTYLKGGQAISVSSNSASFYVSPPTPYPTAPQLMNDFIHNNLDGTQFLEIYTNDANEVLNSTTFTQGNTLLCANLP